MSDVIIVGAGSAGCVLANRLSKDSSREVLLLEAGGADSSPLIHTPGAMLLLQDGVHDWRYRTVPQPGCNMRRFYWPRGRVLGGTSSINYMIYIRGHRSDYDRWAALGNEGWSYEEVLPYFVRAENNERLRDRFHGRGGPLNVADPVWAHPLSEMFVAAAEKAGVPRNPDFNGAHQSGCGFYQVTQKAGARWSSARAYLQPALRRSNLTVVTGAQVTRIRVEKGRAVGVDYLREGRSQTAQTQGEVILSGGAVNSPQLLLLSGVGPADELRGLGIEPVVDLPGVGANLQDHLASGVRAEIDRPLSPYGLTAEQLAEMEAEYATNKSGPLTSNTVQAGGFIRTDPDQDAPNLQLLFLPYCLPRNYAETTRPEQHGVTLVFDVCRPASRGRIRLASADPLDMPLIDPAYLSDPADLPLYLAGIRRVRQILTQRPMGEILGRELSPGADAQADAQLERYVREQLTGTVYHPVGTCKMGVDEQAVVDPQLRVRGVEGLRVVDASIMPTLIGGNTNAPTIMIGEKGADLIGS